LWIEARPAFAAAYTFDLVGNRMTMALASKKRRTAPAPVAATKRDVRAPETPRIASTPVKAKPPAAEPCDFEVSRQIIWDLVSISNHLEDMRRCWAKLFGISGPQWLILMAINDLDQGSGASVGEVSAKIHAVSTFVTKQTKLLEKQGLLNRVASAWDARVVLMSLSDQAREQINTMSERWDGLHDFMFSDFDASTWRDIKYKLELLKKRAKIAVKRASDEM
jgi:DNA-binding MarR family transcriptional regulator